MKARLASYKDRVLDVSHPLPEPGTTIGRHPDNHIRLNDAMISRHHAVVHAKDGMWLIKDLESTNGVVINGARVKHAVLKSGDQVRIGPFEFIFETAADDAKWGAVLGLAAHDDDTTNLLPPASRSQPAAPPPVPLPSSPPPVPLPPPPTVTKKPE